MCQTALADSIEVKIDITGATSSNQSRPDFETDLTLIE